MRLRGYARLVSITRNIFAGAATDLGQFIEEQIACVLLLSSRPARDGSGERSFLAEQFNSRGVGNAGIMAKTGARRELIGMVRHNSLPCRTACFRRTLRGGDLFDEQ